VDGGDAGPGTVPRVGADDVMRLARSAELRCTPARAAVLAPHLTALLDGADALAAAATAPPPADDALAARSLQVPSAPPATATPAAGGLAPGGTDGGDAFLSIRELARLYRTGERSPVAVTGALLRRISAAQPRLNAFVTVLADSAMAGARASEARIRAGLGRGPLDGVAVACKDNIDTAGIPTTCAARIRRDEVPEADAEVVHRLRASGAVLIGKTNLLEFAYGAVHPDFGQGNNPWDPARTAGGSSSGSAAAVGAGLAFAALGTDTGGSIRIPAAYCGVVGLKPTLGAVSTDGVFPLSWTLDHVGPIGRRVDDVALLLAVLDGAGPVADPSAELALGEAGTGPAARLAGLRAAVPLDRHAGDLQAGVAARWEDALRRLAAAGVRLDEVELPSLAYADDALLQIILPEAAVIHASWLRSRPQDYAPDTRLQLELGALAPGTAYVAAQLVRERLVQETRRLLGDHDLIVTPTVAWVAPRSDPALAGPEGAAEARRSGPHNLTGVPAVTLPCGLGDDGLPVGLQLAAAWGRDRRLLEWAAAVEALLGGPLGPPPGWAQRG